MLTYDMFPKCSTLKKGRCKSFKNSMETPVTQYFSMDSRRTSSEKRLAFVRHVFSFPS
ncbi:hypothetical protein DPMN_050249 [Dreissena polymorpha]|uniref:Uncharacterized protein n=1 Tax=Dreissena polymorpha TaxID=45954 RepID=A0A9D4CH47_DREPO|nr:hypothetical protein DPMN_050249 [Dreissena polymorpha]